MLNKRTQASGAADAIGWVIGATLAVSAILVVKGVAWLARKVYALWTARSRKVARDDLDRVTVKPAGTDFSEYEPAITRCVQVPGKGYLLLWAYKGKAVIRRSFRITEKALADEVRVVTVPLPQLDWPLGKSLEAMELEALQGIDAMLVSLKAAASGSSEQATSKDSPTLVKREQPSQAQPYAAALRARADDQKVALSQQPDNAAGQSERPKERAFPPVPKAKHVEPHAAARSSRPLEVHEGIFQDAGVFQRKSGNRAFTQFGVDLLTSRGITQRVWGVDVERALEAVDAKIGDRVRIELAGTTTVVLPKGKTSEKKNYQATILERSK